MLSNARRVSPRSVYLTYQVVNWPPEHSHDFISGGRSRVLAQPDSRCVCGVRSGCGFVIHEGKKLCMVTAEIWKVQSGEMPLLYSTDALERGFSTLLLITGFQMLIHQNVSCFRILGIRSWMPER